MQKTNTLLQSVLIIAIFSVITRFLGFIFRIYLSRELGAELLGVYQVAFSVFMVLLVVISSGLPLAISKFTAIYKVNSNYKAQNGITTSALIVGVLTAGILCLIVYCGQGVLDIIFADSRCVDILVLLLPAVFVSAIYATFRGALWGEQNYYSVSITELFEQVLRILVFVLLMHAGIGMLDGAQIASISMSIACVGSAILVTIIYFAKGKRLGNPKKYFVPVLKSSVPVTGVRVASSVIQPIISVLFPTMLILAGYSSESAMQSYGIVMGMTFPLLFLPSTIIGALSFALIPDLSSAITLKNHDLVKTRIVSSLLFALFLSSAVIPVYLGLGEAIGLTLYDNALSGIYLARASFVMIPLGLSNITSSILNAYNLEVKSFVNNILGGAILLLMMVCGSGLMGVDALIVGFGACMTLTTVLNIIMIKRHTKLHLGLVKPSLKMTLFLIPATMIAYFCYPLLCIVFPQIMALIMAGILGSGSFVLLCWIFKLIDLTGVVIKLTKRAKKSAQNV